ncbi:anti-sigma factor family protein [Noviherbaspirillum galbum]|uniref:Putative zinc-finger domain-containing protein n=1 Tax=Noviherbaspirillum galbum TaxID=2709383 RepID=A0A6B3SYS8_9BURK|nr:zf-HC2 domain-containing protein [Noviherbaspirillum galbum]NEX64756.1 hypothetical protein [Noviherbaspirillum galbum]
MKSQIVNLNLSTHRTVQELLPWYVNGQLAGSELSLVHEHLQTCTQCRADVAWQAQLRAIEPMETPVPDVDAAWRQMQQQLESRSKPWWRRIVERLPLGLPAPTRMNWTAWALAGQAAVILVLGTLLAAQPNSSHEFRALGSGVERQGNILVMFSPQATEPELRKALQDSGARIADGPTASGAYTLEAPGRRAAEVAAELRASGVVMLAEPLAKEEP